MSSQDSSPTTSIFDFDLASTSHLFTLASSHSTPSKSTTTPWYCGTTKRGF
ncbi:hypothetical protein HBI25_121680, partial [Parastagonospora nodorum]